MFFNQILGQKSVQQSLTSWVQTGRYPHASLLLGPAGCGKLVMAVALAQYIFCEDKKPDDSCGQCRHCKKVQKLIHPDLHFTYPVVGSKVTSSDYLKEWRAAFLQNPYLSVNDWLQAIGAENKQGNINKDDCLHIIRQMSLKPFESPYKIQIIWLPEFLQKEGNRLLKLIEEPPANTFFMLVAEEQERILNTILSRCQLIKFQSLPDEIITQELVRQGVDSEKATAIAQLANGNFNEALALTESSESNNAQNFLNWMRKCYLGNGVALVDWVEDFAKLGREQQKLFFQYGLHFMRELMVFQVSGNEQVRLRPSELETAKRLSKVISFEKLAPVIALFSESHFHIERNANPRILGMNVSLQMNKIFKSS